MVIVERASKVFEVNDVKTIAVNELSFVVKEGEFVACLGPNGAGKSTIIKLLTGIIKPSSGSIKVLGVNPFQDRQHLAYNIGVMFGNRTSLWPELSINDTLKLLAKVYKLSKAQFKNQRDYLTEELGLSPIISKPVRTLSLGQRMLGELAVSLLHSPKLLLLDEPTIGLDVLVKERLGIFLEKINTNDKVTIIMSSHDMHEVSKLCKKLIIINSGKQLFNGSQNEIRRISENKLTIKITHEPSSIKINEPSIEIIESNGISTTILLDANILPLHDAITLINSVYTINNLDVEKPGLSEIITEFLKNKMEIY